MVAFDMLDACYGRVLTPLWGDEAGTSGSPPPPDGAPWGWQRSGGTMTSIEGGKPEEREDGTLRFGLPPSQF